MLYDQSLLLLLQSIAIVFVFVFFNVCFYLSILNLYFMMSWYDALVGREGGMGWVGGREGGMEGVGGRKGGRDGSGGVGGVLKDWVCCTVSMFLFPCLKIYK